MSIRSVVLLASLGAFASAACSSADSPSSSLEGTGGTAGNSAAGQAAVAGSAGVAASAAGSSGSGGAGGAAGNGAAGASAGAGSAGVAGAAGSAGADNDAGTDAGDDAAAPINCDNVVELDRADWTATAGRFALYTAWGLNETPANAIDGVRSTRYSSGRASFTLSDTGPNGTQFPCEDNDTPSADCYAQMMSNNDFFQVELANTTSVNQVVVDTNYADADAGDNSTQDFATVIAVDVSTNGTTFTQVAQVTGETVSTICFAAVEAKFIKLRVVTPHAGQWWSIHEFSAFGPAADPDVDAGDAGDAGDADGGVMDSGTDAADAADAALADAASDSSL